MSAIVKKWMNRGGLLSVIAGIVMIVIAGGDPESALQTAGLVAGIAGSLIIIVREIFN